MMKSKLPQNIKSKLEEQKDQTDEWTVETFRKKLKRYITTQEAGNQELWLYHSTNENIFRANANSSNLSDSRMRYTGEDLMLNELSLPHKFSKCIVCDGRNWSNEWRIFQDVFSRKRRLKKRCFICLKEGHLAKECKLQNQVCVHCAEKKKHHRSLYPKTFAVTKTPGAGRNESGKKNHSTRTQSCCSWIENIYTNCPCNGWNWWNTVQWRNNNIHGYWKSTNMYHQGVLRQLTAEDSWNTRILSLHLRK